MRTSTLARGGALLTAVAVAITLGSGPAAASDSHDKTAKAQAVTTPSNSKDAARVDGRSTKRSESFRAPGVEGDPLPWAPTNITEIKQRNIAMYVAGEYIWPGSATYTGTTDGSVGSIDYMFPHLFVGGTDRGALEFAFATPPYDNGTGLIADTATVPTGKARLGPTTVQYVNDETSGHADSVDNTHSNYFYIRRGTYSDVDADDYAFIVKRGNSKISFHAYKWMIFKQSLGGPVAMRTIYLQYRKDHKWVTLKSISLDSNGNGSYTKKAGAVHNYRLYYPTTDTIYGNYTQSSGNI